MQASQRGSIELRQLQPSLWVVYWFRKGHLRWLFVSKNIAIKLYSVPRGAFGPG